MGKRKGVNARSAVNSSNSMLLSSGSDSIVSPSSASSYNHHHRSFGEEKENYESNNTPSSLMSSSLKSYENMELTWKDTTDIMKDLLDHYTSKQNNNKRSSSSSHTPSINDDIDQVLKCKEYCKIIECDKKEELLEESNKIRSEMELLVYEEEEALKRDTKDLDTHKKHVSNLQDEIISLKISQENHLEQIEKIKANIASYREEASQEIEEIDEVEAERIREVPSLKHKISLYANITGIKWNYDSNDDDILEGEITVPSTGCVKKFSIDPSKKSDFDCTNEIWDAMNGVLFN